MLLRCHSTGIVLPASHKSLSSASAAWRSLPTLPDTSLAASRESTFLRSSPALLPKSSFESLPAMNKWFHSRRSKPELNYKYLESFGKALVPLEFTSSLERFVRTKAPLSLFLKWIKQADRETSDRFYLAQASLEDLPKQLREDLPTPLIVSSSGRGDVYASNIWIGLSPTYTPLHRDPNPNLFVQLVGWKRVRLLNPDEGQQAFNNVQQLLKKNESGKFRGDEMMQGDEKELLDREIWDDEYTQGKSRAGFEAELRGGDALFIPQGWWHSIKGTGQGVTGSVNWWFR